MCSNNVTLELTIDKGDALLFDGTYTYKTDTMSSDALWNVNMVPTWKMSSYGA